MIALLFVMMILVLYRGQQFDKEFICGFIQQDLFLYCVDLVLFDGCSSYSSLRYKVKNDEMIVLMALNIKVKSGTCVVAFCLKSVNRDASSDVRTTYF